MTSWAAFSTGSLPPKPPNQQTNPFDLHRFVRTPNVWWLYQLKDARSGFPKDPRELDNLLKKGVSVRITGFLSPIGEYGHMNGYDHEFFATSIVRVEGD